MGIFIIHHVLNGDSGEKYSTKSELEAQSREEARDLFNTYTADLDYWQITITEIIEKEYA